jgi:hypothetical protein
LPPALGRKLRGALRKGRFDTSQVALDERVDLEPGALPSAPAATKRAVEIDSEPDDDLQSVEEKAAAHELRAPGAPDDLSQQADAESRVAAGAEPIPELFARLTLERNADGGLRIEAPADVAGSLVALFEGMAKLLAPLGSRLR